MDIKARRIGLAAVALLVPLLSGCFRAYEMPIQQGNIVTQTMLTKLKPGMTRRQVRYVLGTPLVTDPFNPGRWDYYYYRKRAAGAVPESRRITILFKHDVLAAIYGDVSVAARSAAPAPVPAPSRPATPAPKTSPAAATAPLTGASPGPAGTDSVR